MDSTQPLDEVVAGAGADTVVNELFDAVSAAAMYGHRASTSTGLTWGYFGGRWGGTSVAHGTLSLTANQTNYIVVDLTTGAVSVSTATTNWNDTANYARAYKVVAGASTVSGWEDHRPGPGGTQQAVPSGAGTSPVGKHAVYIAAGAMQPSVSGGCAALASIASAANQPDIVTLDFDKDTVEYAQFGFVMPKSWNEGTITARFLWSHAATATNFGVVWQLQAVAVGNDDAIAAAFGTAQSIADTGGTTNDLYRTDETPAITVGGTPQAEDMVFFRVSRLATDGTNDTLAVDARLHGIELFITTDAPTDA